MILKVILFLSHVLGWIWDADPCWCCCGKHNKQVFLLAFGRAEIQNVDAKLGVPFVATVLCGLDIVVKETFGCLMPVVCKLSLQCKCSCYIYDFLQSSMLAPNTVLHYPMSDGFVQAYGGTRLVWILGSVPNTPCYPHNTLPHTARYGQTWPGNPVKILPFADINNEQLLWSQTMTWLEVWEWHGTLGMFSHFLGLEEAPKSFMELSKFAEELD